MHNVTIKVLTPALLEDYLKFFDEYAFADNPQWFGCYCMYFHFNGSNEEWDARPPLENRDAVSELIRRGKFQGLLAYVDGKPVGWCHAAPRMEMSRLGTIPELRIEDAERVGSIVCFIIAHPFRRRGIARLLLDAACDLLSSLGLSIAEAYPVKEAKTDAENYRGPLTLYLSAGFKPFRELKDTIIVRKTL